MFLLQQILPAAVVAMLTAAGVCGLALVLGKERLLAMSAPLAIGAGYVAGHLFVTGWISLPPADTTNWLPCFALGGGILGACCALLRINAWVRILIFVFASIGALRLMLRPKFQYAWSLHEGWTWVVCLGCAMVLLAVVLDALVRRSGIVIEIPAFLLIICAGAFGALVLSGSMLLGQFAAILGAAVFGSLVLSVRNIAPGRGIVPVFSLLMGALLVSGYFFASLPATSAVLLAFALLPALIRVTLPGKSLAFGVRAVFVLVPVGVALVLAFLASPPLDY